MARNGAPVEIVSAEWTEGQPATLKLSAAQEQLRGFIDEAWSEYVRDVSEHDGKIVDRNMLGLRASTEEGSKTLAGQLRSTADKMGRLEDGVGWALRVLVPEDDPTLVLFRIAGKIKVRGTKDEVVDENGETPKRRKR